MELLIFCIYNIFMKFEYYPKGVCSTKYTLDINDEDVIDSLTIENGCPGNTMGISKIVVGMKVDDVIEDFEGIDCRGRGTSCPDQIAHALKAYKLQKA